MVVKKLFCLSALLLISLIILPSVQAAEILVQDKDLKSGVGYTVITDDATLTMAFDFSGPIRLMQMARNGFTVYVSPNGKKKTTQGLIVKGLRPPRRNEGGMAPERDQFSASQGDKPELPVQGENQHPKPEKIPFNYGLWINGVDTTQILFDAGESTGFKAYLDQDDGKNRCVVVITLDAVDMKGKKPKDMMVGLMSEPTEKGAMPALPKGEGNGQQPPVDFQGGDRREGGMPGPPPGGGMGGPGGGRGGRGPGMGPGGSSASGQNASSNKIEVWFKCR